MIISIEIPTECEQRFLDALTGLYNLQDLTNQQKKTFLENHLKNRLKRIVREWESRQINIFPE
ncbi:MAG TPA: hypothetical protein PLV55_06005 [Anaerohalosphaeraceae bacterium]|nr:hypothetical protein [Anaerohalosphaeraceae bacterium]